MPQTQSGELGETQRETGREREREKRELLGIRIAGENKPKMKEVSL